MTISRTDYLVVYALSMMQAEVRAMQDVFLKTMNPSGDRAADVRLKNRLKQTMNQYQEEHFSAALQFYKELPREIDDSFLPGKQS